MSPARPTAPTSRPSPASCRSCCAVGDDLTAAAASVDALAQCCHATDLEIELVRRGASASASARCADLDGPPPDPRRRSPRRTIVACRNAGARASRAASTSRSSRPASGPSAAWITGATRGPPPRRRGKRVVRELGAAAATRSRSRVRRSAVTGDPISPDAGRSARELPRRRRRDVLPVRRRVRRRRTRVRVRRRLRRAARTACRGRRSRLAAAAARPRGGVVAAFAACRRPSQLRRAAGPGRPRDARHAGEEPGRGIARPARGRPRCSPAGGPAVSKRWPRSTPAWT